jgi:single-strand DNA-binding protein
MEFRLPSINKVTIVGNLLTNAELLFVTEKKIPVVNFRIASNKKFRNQSGERIDKVCYTNIVAWSKLAEACSRNLRIGDGVYVEGELQTRLVAHSGQQITVTEVLANKIQFLTKHFEQHDHDEANFEVEDQREER